MLISEAATETVFQKYMFFFSRSNLFYNFPGGSICLSNRHVFSKMVYLFVEQVLLSHRTDTYFSRNPYFVLEHIRIFQEPLFSHRTDINFPGASIFSSNRYSFSRKPYLVLEHILFSKRPLYLEQRDNFEQIFRY